MLSIIATPIGNLDDITARALKALQECDAVLCEDTRRSSILLQKFEIQKPLISYHLFKEKQALESVIRRLMEGQNLTLISDAGTPCINDPGLILVQECIKRNIPFTALPGPCSVIQALVLSGIETERFQFIGYLPRKPQDALQLALCYPGTTICFESPERLMASLRALEKLDPLRKIAVVREMTKIYEEVIRGDVGFVRDHFEKIAPRGEIVIVIAPGKMCEEEMDLDVLIDMLKDLHGLSFKEAIKMAAKLKKTPKSSIYKQAHSKN